MTVKLLCRRLTLTETPLLVLVIVVACGAPEPSIPPSISGTVIVLRPLEEEWEDAGFSMGCTSIHHRNCQRKKKTTGYVNIYNFIFKQILKFVHLNMNIK